jgi:hypothetical protein
MTRKIVIISLSCLALALGGVVWLFVAFYVSMERGEEHRRQLQAEQRSGKWDFGDQQALFAVAHAIVKNDQEAIRVAAKALPDLQAPGRDGTTLLYFAVTQSWQRPELVEAVKTLLSLGANPTTPTATGIPLPWRTPCMGLLFSCATCLRPVAIRMLVTSSASLSSS